MNDSRPCLLRRGRHVGRSSRRLRDTLQRHQAHVVALRAAATELFDLSDNSLDQRLNLCRAARNEFFELLEDATTPPSRLARARATWHQHARQAQTLKGLAVS